MNVLRIEVMTAVHNSQIAAHNDALEIMRRMTALYEWVAVVEAKQTS